MRHGISNLLLGLVAVCLSQAIFALGLGDIKLNTALNQPLRAEIELFETRDLSEREIFAGLASSKDFSAQGLDRPYFLTDLRFIVKLNGTGGGVIELTSRKPVTEPFLNFILELQWPSGRLLREYTMLMDLPLVDSERAPAAVYSAQSDGPSPSDDQRQTESRDNSRSAYDSGRESSSSGSTPSSRATTYGPVNANDTLWEIAAANRPGGVSVQQTMLAIQRLNPEAFIDGNINLLRRGQILRMPDQAEMAAYDSRQAVSEVAVQNNAWQAKLGERLAGNVDGATLDASAPSSYQPSEPTPGEGRLSLASSGDNESAGSGSSAVTDALKDDLNSTLEQLDASRRENDSLKETVQSLEEQISTLERLIEVSSSELQGLQQAAAQTAENSVDEPAYDAEGRDSLLDPLATIVDKEALQIALPDPLGADAQLSDEQLSDEQLPDEQLSADDPMSDNLEPPQTTDVAAVETEDQSAESSQVVTEQILDPSKVVIPKAKEPGFIDILKDNLFAIAAVLLAIIVGLIVWLKKRGKPEEEDPLYSDIDEREDDSDFSPDDSDMDFDEALDVLDEANAKPDGPDPDEDVEDDHAVSAETGDVAAEADIYIALGQYEEAEALLSSELEQSPENQSARLKLLEVYSERGDVEKFDPHYAALLMASASVDMTNRASQLRSAINHAGEFDLSMYELDAPSEVGGLDDAEAGELSDEDDLDFDLALEDIDDVAEELRASDDTVLMNRTQDEGGFDLDFESDAENEGASEFNSGEFNSGEFNAEDLSGVEDPLSTDLEGLHEASDELILEEAGADDEGLGLDLDLDDDETETVFSGDELDLDFDLDDGELGIDTGDLESVVSDLSPPVTDDELSSLAMLGDPLELDSELESGDPEGGIDVGLAPELGSDVELDLNTEDLGAEFVPMEEPVEEPLLEERVGEEGIAAEATLEEGSAHDSSVAEDMLAQHDAAVLDSDLDLGDMEPAVDSESMVVGAEGESFDIDLDEPSGDDDEMDLSSQLASLDAELDLALDDDAEDSSSDTQSPKNEQDSAAADMSIELLDEVDQDGEVSIEREPDPGSPLLESELESLDSEIESIGVALDEDASSTAMEEPEVDFGESEESALEDNQYDSELEAALAQPVSAYVTDEGAEGDMEPPVISLDDRLDDDGASVKADDSIGVAQGATSEDFYGGQDVDLEAALADDLEFEIPEIDPESLDDDDLDFLSSSDETSTKLDLARAYIDMGDAEGAKDIIDEVLKEGSGDQKLQAKSLLDRLAG